MSKMYAMLVICVLVLCYSRVSGGMAPVAVKTGNRDFAFPDEVDTGKLPSRSNYRMHYHHHHHHHPDFPYHNFGWDEDREGEGSPKVDGPSNTSLQIPLEFIQNINQHDVNDLLLNFVEGDGKDGAFIQDRFGEDGEERNAAVMAKKAACMPELQTVKIASTDDPSVIYIPECTRIERCGGCCSHVLLSCQPEEVEYVSYKIIKTQYTGGQKLKIVGKEVVLVEKHNKCKCDCRVQAEDCNKFQEYRKSECRCACTNHDEEKKCYKNNATKLWNPDMCTCQCRETSQCSTGSYFDQRDCKCVPIPMKRRFANYGRSNDYDQVQVVPLEGDD